MEAMILAAGEGTRLRPLTDTLPKALVRVGGRPLLERVLEYLAQAGARRVIVNVCHHQDQIRAWVRERPPGGVEVVLSPEPGGPYDTGGGLFAARHLFRQATPFLLHNVDVLSTIPLDGLMVTHREAAGGIGDRLVATLAVRDRESRRALLFDEEGLFGWENRGSDRAPEGARRVREPVGEVRRLSFTGIHVVEPHIFQLTPRRGTFSIITLYLELAAAGYRILPADVSRHPWIDVGTPERLAEAERVVGSVNGGSGGSYPDPPHGGEGGDRAGNPAP
jgi:NDP-sugar pyrophosphorylase family protein